MKKLMVLGTGIAITTKYYNTAFVLEENDEYFLVDGTGGIDILRQFEHFGIEWTKLHHAFLSHEHTDHFLGMVWVLRMVAHNMRIGEYEGDFTLYGHDVVIEKIESVARMILQPLEIAFFGSRILFQTVTDHENIEIMGHSCTFFDIESTKAKQFGFQLEYEQGKLLTFLGDEPLSSNGEKYCENVDWLLSEAFCLYSEHEIHTPYRYHHATAKDAAQNAERFHAKNLILWHTEDLTYGRRQELYTKEAEEYYHGNIFVPDDGDVFFI